MGKRVGFYRMDPDPDGYFLAVVYVWRGWFDPHSSVFWPHWSRAFGTDCPDNFLERAKKHFANERPKPRVETQRLTLLDN